MFRSELKNRTLGIVYRPDEFVNCLSKFVAQVLSNSHSRTMSNISSVTSGTGALSMFEPTVAFFIISYSIATVGLVLNFIEIHLIVKVWNHATDFELVLLNLAVADVLNCLLFTAVTGISHYTFNNRSIVSSKAERLFWIHACHTFSVMASTSFVIVIGVERFFAAKLPLKHRLWHTSRRKLLMCISITWGFDIIVSTTLALINYFATDKKIMFASKDLSYFTTGLLTAGLVLVSILYMWLAHLVLMRSMKLFEFDNKDFSVNAKSIKRAMTKEKATVIVCALVVVVLFICDLPIIVDLFLQRLTQTAVLLLKLNSIANPVIYFFKGYFEKYYAKKTLVPSSGMKGLDHNKGSSGKSVEDVR